MGYKDSDIKVYGRFWSETTDGKIIDASQIDGDIGGGSLESGPNNNDASQLKQTAKTFQYNGTNWKSPTFDSGAYGDGSTLFETLGRINRNHFMSTGNLNVVDYVDSETPYEENDDGGIVAGYKNICNSRAASVFGAWNRAIKAKCSLTGGYQNSTIGNGSGNACCINFGEKNYLTGTISSNIVVGMGLRNNNNVTAQAHFGRWNDHIVDGLAFSIGNGSSATAYYYHDTWAPKTLQGAINANKSNQYSPNLEGMLYLKMGSIYKFIDDTVTESEYEAYDVYIKENKNRSNAFQVLTNGTAQLIRKGTYNLGDTDLLTKSEIKTELQDYAPTKLNIEGTTYNLKLVSENEEFTPNADDIIFVVEESI